ncbi:MAG TPA: lipid-A-disaccharide synthase [Gemmatimonadales bacterium]|nr:lipid-A-disaccharide synthase [Gemmatimonadales bacterium]
MSAGEPSGDLHGGPLALALRERFPSLTLEALGGSHLAGAGAAVRFSIEGFSALGFAEVIRTIPAHWRLLRTLRRDFRAGRYDLIIPVDYPGFNLRLAEAARRSRVPVLYYIAPKHWAAGTRLTPRFARAVSRVACILPFEPEFFARFGVPAEYVGHPLLDQPALPSRSEARWRLGIQDSDRVLALFPGSRPQEIERLWPQFREAARRVLKDGGCNRVLVAARAGLTYGDPEAGLTLVTDSGLVLAAADAAIVKSGTATLETALAGVPMVVAYRVHPVTAWLARRIMRVRWVSLVNLIAGQALVPELLQGEANADRLVAEVLPLLDRRGSAPLTQRAGFERIRERLGSPGAAIRVAAMAEELLGIAGAGAGLD